MRPGSGPPNPPGAQQTAAVRSGQGSRDHDAAEAMAHQMESHVPIHPRSLLEIAQQRESGGLAQLVGASLHVPEGQGQQGRQQAPHPDTAEADRFLFGLTVNSLGVERFAVGPRRGPPRPGCPVPTRDQALLRRLRTELAERTRARLRGRAHSGQARSPGPGTRLKEADPRNRDAGRGWEDALRGGRRDLRDRGELCREDRAVGRRRTAVPQCRPLCKEFFVL